MIIGVIFMSVQSISDYRQKVIETSLPILRKHGAKKAALFGSLLREDFDFENSDIDILIDVEKPFWDFLDIKFELEDALNKKIDLIPYKNLDGRIKAHVQELVIL